MAKPYTSEQFWKIYKKLPEELKTALSSEETGDNIYNVCKKNNAEDKLGEIIEYVGAVLIGLILPENFQEALEKKLFLEKDKAKNIAHEINQLIFYPVKTEIEQININENNFEEEGLDSYLKEEIQSEEEGPENNQINNPGKDFESNSQEVSENDFEKEPDSSFLNKETIDIMKKYKKIPEIKKDHEIEKKPIEKKERLKEQKEKPKKSSGKDLYREPIQ